MDSGLNRNQKTCQLCLFNRYDLFPEKNKSLFGPQICQHNKRPTTINNYQTLAEVKAEKPLQLPVRTIYTADNSVRTLKIYS